jgi:hypothetical protein
MQGMLGDSWTLMAMLSLAFLAGVLFTATLYELAEGRSFWEAFTRALRGFL